MTAFSIDFMADSRITKLEQEAKLWENHCQLTWDNVTKFDDIPPKGTKELIEQIEADNSFRCPYLRKAGETWYYCGVGVPEKIDPRPFMGNPVYKSHQDTSSLQLYCMSKLGHEKCMHFPHDKRD